MQMAANNPNAHTYSSSSVMHYSSFGGEGGQPKVYHATTSTRQAPGGVRKTLILHFNHLTVRYYIVHGMWWTQQFHALRSYHFLPKIQVHVETVCLLTCMHHM